MFVIWQWQIGFLMQVYTFKYKKINTSIDLSKISKVNGNFVLWVNSSYFNFSASYLKYKLFTSCFCPWVFWLLWKPKLFFQTFITTKISIFWEILSGNIVQYLICYNFPTICSVRILLPSNRQTSDILTEHTVRKL